MSSVQYTFPKSRLSAQLKAAGGMPVAEALEAAEANLAELAPPCLTELRLAANDALAALQGFPAQFDRAALEELYAIAARAVGIGRVSGAPSADLAFISLCDLLDHFSSGGLWDLGAIAVHVHTLQLLVSDTGQQMDAASAERLLVGLRKVTARYGQDRLSLSASAPSDPVA